MKEEIITWGDDTSYVGIFTHGKMGMISDDFCIIFLNAGLIHKIGPNRIYVKIARALADKGINSFRFDFSGQGDSEISSVRENTYKIKDDEVNQAINIVQSKTGIERFVLIGICSGAESAFDASFDKRIIGLSLLDGIYQRRELSNKIFHIANSRCKIRYYKKYIFSLTRWAKLLKGNSQILNKKSIIGAVNRLKNIIKTPKQEHFSKQPKQEVDKDVPNKYDLEQWNSLFQRKVKIQLIFCEGGIAIDIFRLTISKHLQKLNQSKALTVEFIKDVDHTFTPLWSQDLLVESIRSWLKTLS